MEAYERSGLPFAEDLPGTRGYQGARVLASVGGLDTWGPASPLEAVGEVYEGVRSALAF